MQILLYLIVSILNPNWNDIVRVFYTPVHFDRWQLIRSDAIEWRLAFGFYVNPQKKPITQPRHPVNHF